MPKRDPKQPMGGTDYDGVMFLGAIAPILFITALIFLTWRARTNGTEPCPGT